MAEFVFVCATFDVPHAECREFRAGGRRVLICEDGGRYYAHSAVCAHQDYSLDGARVCYGAISCPWHGFTFDVVTGCNEYPGRVYPVGFPGPSKAIGSLDTYQTEVRGQHIYVAFADST